MLTGGQLIRYEKHIELDHVGEQGQEKLLQSNVVLVGAGGLGCPIALYLAASGIGNLTVIDDDEISLSNLQRQILYETQDQKELKVVVVEKRLKKINPDCNIIPIKTRVDKSNIDEFISNQDLVIDGSDNFKTRYLLNDACHRNSKTLVSGSILYFDGQISVYKSYLPNFPCYQCLYPHIPGPHEVPACVDSAILSPVAGVVGTFSAVETIKELLGIGKTLAGFLLLYSALDSEVKKIAITKNKDCKICG